MNSPFRQFLGRIFFPVVALQLGLLPFWFADIYKYSSWLPITQLLITGFFLPGYLATIGSRFVSSESGWHGFFALLIISIAVSIAVFLDYFAWGASTGLFWNPDEGTVMVMELVSWIAYFVALVPPFLTLIIRYARSDSHRST